MSIMGAKMRTTRAQIEGAFKVWVEMVGGKVSKGYNDVGGYALDYVACYGGWRIIQICNERSGQRDVTNRMGATQFWEALHFAIRTIEEQRTAKRLEHVARCPKKGIGCAHFTASGEVKQ
jgi:hypothetical protein